MLVYGRNQYSAIGQSSSNEKKKRWMVLLGSFYPGGDSGIQGPSILCFCFLLGGAFEVPGGYFCIWLADEERERRIWGIVLGIS